MQFESNEIQIEKLISSPASCSNDPAQETKLVLGPIETRNIVIKSSDTTTYTQEQIRLSVNWVYTANNEKSSKGTYSIRIPKAQPSPKSNQSEDFVFQLQHPSRATQDFNHFSFYTCPVQLQITSKSKKRICLKISSDGFK